jgi:phage portal protein BeeE
MFAYYPQSQFQPCPDCGAPVQSEEDDAHRCEQRRFVEYQMLVLRPEIVAFEAELCDWLDTPQGRFAAYYAERERDAALASF